MNTGTKRIDLHHHVFPPQYVAEMARAGRDWTGGAGVPAWSLDLARETMERHGIAATVASPQPEVYWGDAAEAIRWARHSNEFLAGIVRDDPQHFGGFGALPLPDTGTAVRETAYIYDHLKLDGVMLYTSYGPRYLGHPDFEELYQELDRRSAVVFVHPTIDPVGSEAIDYKLPNFLVEFTFDTTRAILTLIYSGTLERYPNIRFIMPHAGGTAPYLAWRMGLGQLSAQLRERAPKGAEHYLQRLFYDTALSVSPSSLAALTQAVPSSQIVYGSDFPFLPDPLIGRAASDLDQSPFFDAPTREAVLRGNALKLFPRFAAQAV